MFSKSFVSRYVLHKSKVIIINLFNHSYIFLSYLYRQGSNNFIFVSKKKEYPIPITCMAVVRTGISFPSERLFKFNIGVRITYLLM